MRWSAVCLVALALLLATPAPAADAGPLRKVGRAVAQVGKVRPVRGVWRLIRCRR